jgi:FlaG protein
LPDRAPVVSAALNAVARLPIILTTSGADTKWADEIRREVEVMQQEWTGSVSQVGPVRAALPVQPLGASTDGRPTPSAHEHDSVEIRGANPPLHAYAKFIVHEDDNDVSVQIIDAMTDQVIREIPQREVLRIAEQVKAYMAAKQRHAG